MADRPTRSEAEPSEMDETTARREITDAMIAAGVLAYVDWKDRRKTDPALSRSDLATSVYVAMRRIAQKR